MDTEDTFESGDAGSSLTYPTSIGELKKGSHMCINGRPAKVIIILI
jgi:translation initiation factor 5A